MHDLEAYTQEIITLEALDGVIRFKHPVFAEKHMKMYHEIRAWFIAALQDEYPDDWKQRIEDFDTELIKLKDNQPELVHYLNSEILGFYKKQTSQGLTRNNWDDKERKAFTDFIEWMIENSLEMKNKGEIPPGLGGISIKDLPDWFFMWEKSKNL